MQRLTFTQKLFRQRNFLRSLVPLLALFIGLGAWQQALGQTISSTNFFLNRTISGTTTATTYGGSSSVTPNFSGANFGSFDINTPTSLLFNGGELTFTGPPAPNGAQLLFQIYDVATGNPVNSRQSIPLAQTSAIGSVYTYSINNAQRSIISLISAAGFGAGNYEIDARFSVSTRSMDYTDAIRTASFTVTGTLIAAPTITGNTVFAAPNGGTNVAYGINPPTSQPFVGNGNTLGTNYDVNSGQLLLNGGTVTTTEAGPNVVNNAFLYYRVRSGTVVGAYQSIMLTLTNTSGGTKTFSLTTAQLNLIASSTVTAAGQYFVDVYFQANGTNTSTTAPFSITDPNNTNSPYTGSFSVSGTPIAQTIWVGGINDNWFDARNWSAGVPNANVNALVRDLGAGNSVPYPSIYANAQSTTSGGVVLYDNTNSGPATARNLTMLGSTLASRSEAKLVAGRLKVYGDFNNNYDSFTQFQNTNIEFAGTNQTISNGTFVNIDISGGGTKTINGIMNVTTSVNFIASTATGSTPAGATGGVLATIVSQPTSSQVILADRIISNNGGATIPGAVISGETDASYIYGIVKTTRGNVALGETLGYGNTGMTLTFTGTNAPGNVEVIRNTAESYSPLNTKYGIRRIYTVTPSNQAAANVNGGLLANMVFHYRDAETMNLGGATTTAPGPGSIPEPRLTIFVSTNSGNTFQLVGRDGAVDATNNLVSKNGVRTFSTFTLGDQDNPLPVRLTAFDAKRLGNNALVTWQTASEINSQGYEVQVSTDGTEFHTLASVPSAAPNSIRLTSYSYEDKETNKTGIRYYRLRQIDLDGKDAFFAPRAVSFEGKASASDVVAYPSPFNSNDELHVAFQSNASGKGNLRITDMTGRMISQQSVELTTGLVDLSVADMKAMNAGLYLIKLTLPTGEVKNLKVIKQ